MILSASANLRQILKQTIHTTLKLAMLLKFYKNLSPDNVTLKIFLNK